MRMGSEEFYSSRIPDQQYSPYQTNRDTLDLIDRHTERKLKLQKQVGDLYAEGIREPAGIWADTIAKAPDSFMKGAEFKQRSEEGHQRLREGEQRMKETEGRMGLQNLQSEEAKFNMERKRKEAEFLDQPVGPGGVTRGQQMMLDEVEGRKLTQEQARHGMKSQDRMLGLQEKQFGESQRSANIEKYAGVLKDALKSGDPQAIATVQAHGKRMGLTQMEMQFAEAQAKSGIGGDTMAQNVAFAGTDAGARASEEIGQTNNKINALAQLLSDAREYNAAPAKSQKANVALSKIKQSLSQIGEDPDQVNAGLLGVSADTSGIKTTTSKVYAAVNRVRGDVKREINLLEGKYGNMGSPAVKQQIATLKQVEAQLDLLAGAKVNIFTGASGAPQQTQLIRAMQGGGGGQFQGMQQQPMQQPAGPQITFAPGVDLNQVQRVSPFRNSQQRR